MILNYHHHGFVDGIKAFQSVYIPGPYHQETDMVCVYGVCQCMVSLWAWAWAWRLIIHNTADCCSASPLLSSDGEILSRSPDTLTPTPPQHSVTAEE